MCEQEGTNCTEAQEVCGSACFDGDEVAFNNCVFDFCALGGDYGMTETCLEAHPPSAPSPGAGEERRGLRGAGSWQVVSSGGGGDAD